MHIVIIGAGKVGFSLAQLLSLESHDVTVIEKDEERLRIVEEHLDVQAFEGSGASAKLLEEIGIRKADMFIAVTELDELNMIACCLAKQYGVPKTVARVRNPEYVEQDHALPEGLLGIDLIINPERVTAKVVKRLLQAPEAINVEHFAEGKVQLLELRITPGLPIINKSLSELKLSPNFLVVTILRNDQMIIPRGNDRILLDDLIFVLGKTKEMVHVVELLGIERRRIEKVVILGGGRIGYYLASALERLHLNVRIIERNRQKCQSLVKRLEHTLVINGDGTDVDLLKEEGVGDADAFVSVTGDDKLNLLVSLIAKDLGVHKTIAQIRRSELVPLVKRVGVDTVVSPKILTTGAILKFIRGGDIVSVTLLDGTKAEMSEIIVHTHSTVTGKPLNQLKFPSGAILGSIVREDQVIIPRGKDMIMPGDRIMVFALPGAVNKVQRLFALK